MSKKIIILNGSSRANGNTEILSDAFAEGAREAGHSVTKFNLGEMNIHPCSGCLKGGANAESPCTQKDDMDKIYKVYREADTIVLASPLYYWSFSGLLKNVIDRLYAIAEIGERSSRKESVMIIAAGDASPANFAPIEDYYNTLVNNLSWTDKGRILAGGVLYEGDVEGRESLMQAKELGKNL